MAYENVVAGPVGLVADSDLSAKQYYIMKVSAAGKVDVCGDGELMIGVLQNKPSADGMGATLAGVGSVSKVVAGAAITAGDKVASDSAGKAVTAADGDWMLGIALDTVANDAEIVTVYICPVSLGIDDDIS